MAGDVGVPHILAHHDAQTMAAERRHRRQGAGREDAGLVEHAVIGQVMLEDHRGDESLIEQQDGVETLRSILPGRADQQRRSAIPGRRRQFVRGLGDLAKETILQHQILGRIARQAQLRQDHKVGPFCLLTRVEHAADIAGDVADRRIDLGQREGKRFGHGDYLGNVAPAR